MPNIAGEVYFAKRWSVGVSVLYADWAYDSGKQFWGLSAYSVEPRLWFRGDGLFRGFFVGVYGDAGDFNNQRDRRDDITTLTNLHRYLLECGRVGRLPAAVVPALEFRIERARRLPQCRLQHLRPGTALFLLQQLG